MEDLYYWNLEFLGIQHFPVWFSLQNSLDGDSW
jgi:hypothetical protein